MAKPLSAGASAAIEVVVPVYNAPRDLERCVESVLEHTRGRYELVLIDDASPDPGVGRYFERLAARGLAHVTLLRNERNLGFTGTANRGMTRSRADVVLLNSDAIVTDGWLDAILRCAASDATIGTITPFSNNAEIASFPRLCVNEPWPEGADPERTRAAIAAAAVPIHPDLPTGVGFCMFVRRGLIDAVGPFDVAFGAGYGEENDFCMRAHAAGWRNVLCDDAFVLHTGGQSFQGAKETLGVRNTALLVARHPDYLAIVRDFIERDPLAALREAARTAYDRMYGARAVLHVMHGGGGTESYARTLADATHGRLRHVFAIARGDDWRIEEWRTDGSVMHCQFGRRPEEPLEDFLRVLCDVYGCALVHVHHISGSRALLHEALPRLQLPFVLTVHDLYLACPTITLHRPDGFFCGGVTDTEACNACLDAQPGFAGIDIARWRHEHGDVVRAAAAVIAPSTWAADLVRRYFPGVDVDVIPHALPERPPRSGGAVQVVLMPQPPVPTVAVVGAIGPDKGARRVERLAALAEERGVPVRFVVVGYLDRRPDAWQSDDGRLTVHGRYDARDLATLLDHYGASLVLYPSAGPESFAYTLSEVWQAGRPVLVPPIGALAERVDAHGAGWIMSEDEWRDESRMLDRVLALISPHARDALHAASRRAATMPLPTIDAMVERTVGAYERAMASKPVVHAPVERLRVAEAFGYRRWSPPRASGPEAAAPGARAGGSRLGRLLERLTTPDAARSRLR